MVCLFASVQTTNAQNRSAGDTAVSFKVSGACEMCKERIEKNAKGRGVKTAVWDVDTKMLELVYNSSLVSLEKIQNRIVAAGHDVDNKKAKDAVYNQLPECCHYRDGADVVQHVAGMTRTEDTLVQLSPAADMQIVKGIVLEEDSKGNLKPLSGATALWLNTSHGAVTDSAGLFEITPHAENNRLVISYSGYKADTITITKTGELKIILASQKQLKEVTVIARQRNTYVSAATPIRTQMMTGNELLKAACCNLSESFETNPSVDVSYNDAVTGSKQIQLLGLSGNYTQLTVENLPGPRGIATPLGLNAVAGPWIESIQLTKGTGSVANGYESIAGQINVELKKPENSEQLLANVYVNDFGKTDLNLNLSKKINKKWSAGLLLHDNFYNNAKLDFNKDGFRDLPTGNTFSLVNRYRFDNGNGLMTQFGFKVFIDDRTGGETAFDPAKDKNTTSHYGLGINTKRYEGFAKIGYIFPEKKYKSIGLQLSAVDNTQDSYFGLTGYDATQKTFYANLIYQSIINNTRHKFRAGASFLHDGYNENFKGVNFNRTENVPGVFGEYTFSPNEKFSAVAGLRADHNNLYGFFVTPRINVRYQPAPLTTIRVSAGRGQRTANIFAENTGVFVSSRNISILNAAAGKAYGLDAEIAWNKGISIDQKFKLFGNDGLLSLDYFRNDFINQVVVDMEAMHQIKFYNLQGKSFSNSVQAELNIEPVKKLELRLAYRWFDVQTTYTGELKERPLIAKHRAFANLAYAVAGFKFDYTITYNGKKRMPASVTGHPYHMGAYSPSYVLMNAQVSKTFGSKYPFDVYVGAENLADYFQMDTILGASQPFGSDFDAAMIWGPVNGRMLYAGLRFKIK